MMNSTLLKLLCLAGFALGSTHVVAADIRDNTGVPMPPGALPFVTDFDGPLTLTVPGFAPVTCHVHLHTHVDYDPAGSFPLHTGISLYHVAIALSGPPPCPMLVPVPSTTGVVDNTVAPSVPPTFIDPAPISYPPGGEPLFLPTSPTCPGPFVFHAFFGNGTGNFTDPSYIQVQISNGPCVANGRFYSQPHPTGDVNIF